ncbi:MAG: glycosyltransferase, partial [Blastochloris sp.]|nr:glycosyltransferase [Blastochloris sp.]
LSSKNDARIKLQLPPEATILLTVARLSSSERYKGHREVIQLLPQLIKTNPNILYHIVGDGDDRLPLAQEVSRLHLENAVHFSGRLSPQALELAYTACDAFVMPSTGEGFGIVYLEALVRGRPVLAGNVDGSVDPLLDGKLGLLADPHNPEELLEKLKCLLYENPFPDPGYLKQQALAHFGPEKLQLRTDILIHSYLFPQTNKPENS